MRESLKLGGGGKGKPSRAWGLENEEGEQNGDVAVMSGYVQTHIVGV